MALAASIGVSKRDADEAWLTLCRGYLDPRRKYHTFEHVRWVLRRIDEMASVESHRGAKFDARTWNLIRWAAWFHDAVLSGSPDDEQLSADRACDFLGPDDSLLVRKIIMATTHDRVPLLYEAAVLCDADLAILGAEPEQFDDYECRVREEWAQVPDRLFQEARAAILKRFTRRPWIYMTEYGRQRWENQARTNLHRSLEKLAVGGTE